MDFNSNPMLQRGMKKISMILFGWFLLEIACFIVVGYFIGGWNVFWIQFGTLILGYLIKPAKKSGTAGMMPGLGSVLPSGRGIAATLLMIPGFISDLAALVMLIPPLRKLVLALIMRQFMPKSMDLGSMFGQMDPEMLKKMSQAYGDPNDFQGAGASRKRKNRKPSKDVIDVDAEIDGKKIVASHAEVVRPEAKIPKALPEDNDVVDVKYEIES